MGFAGIDGRARFTERFSDSNLEHRVILKPIDDREFFTSREIACYYIGVTELDEGRAHDYGLEWRPEFRVVETSAPKKSHSYGKGGH